MTKIHRVIGAHGEKTLKNQGLQLPVEKLTVRFLSRNREIGYDNAIQTARDCALEFRRKTI
jgi:hypothetical protein